MVESIYCFIMALLGLSTLILIIIKECTANEQKKLSLTAAIYVMLFITFAFVLLGQLVIILLAVISEAI